MGVGHIAAFVFLWFSLRRGAPLGIAYAVWAGVGVLLLAVIRWVVFRESPTWVKILGMLLVVAGVVLLESGRSTRPRDRIPARSGQ